MKHLWNQAHLLSLVDMFIKCLFMYRFSFSLFLSQLVCWRNWVPCSAEFPTVWTLLITFLWYHSPHFPGPVFPVYWQLHLEVYSFDSGLFISASLPFRQCCDLRQEVPNASFSLFLGGNSEEGIHFYFLSEEVT